MRVLQLLAVVQDILRRDLSFDLKVLEGAKIRSHLVQGIYRGGFDGVRFLTISRLRPQRRRETGREHEHCNRETNSVFHEMFSVLELVTADPLQVEQPRLSAPPTVHSRTARSVQLVLVEIVI